ncbi:hypothetical protein AX17_004386 [Amanita inopinata Kibby_2008]|nr:hypothetical protein AX17_004386 [Amanita inopinata Kibby_2008]
MSVHLYSPSSHGFHTIDDKMLMVWNLYPNVLIPPLQQGLSSHLASRLQPTAYVIPFAHSLTSINAHSSSGKNFLVADCKGSVHITDWSSDPHCQGEADIRRSTVVELLDPPTMVATAGATCIFGSAAWEADDVDIIGAVYGSRFCVWDVKLLQGGRPFATGVSFPEGGHHFCWCDTSPEYFAIASKSSFQGAVVNVYNLNYIHMQPTSFQLAPRPHIIGAIDFVTLERLPHIAAAIGCKIIIFHIG